MKMFNRKLLLCNEEWKRIHGHLEPANANEQANQHKQYLDYLKNLTEKLSSAWPKSSDSGLKKEKERIAKIHKEWKDVDEKLKEIKGLNRIESLKRAEEEIFKNSDDYRLLNRARGSAEQHFYLCEQIKEKEDIMKEKKIKEDVEAKRNADILKNKEHEEVARMETKFAEDRTEMVQRIREKEDKIKSNAEEKRKLDLEYKELLQTEARIYDKNVAATKERDVARVVAALEECIEQKNARKIREEKYDRAVDAINQLYNDYTCKIECTQMKINREKKIKSNSKQRVVAEGLGKILAEKEKESETYLNKTIGEYERKLKATESKDLKKNKIKIESFSEGMKRLNEERERKRACDASLKIWQMASHLKNAEIFEKANRKIEEEKKASQNWQRDRLKEQWWEKEKKKQLEREDKQNYQKECNNVERSKVKKLLNYASDEIKKCEQNGRPIKPMEQFLKDYKERNKLFLESSEEEKEQIKVKQQCRNRKKVRNRKNRKEVKDVEYNTDAGARYGLQDCTLRLCGLEDANILN